MERIDKKENLYKQQNLSMAQEYCRPYYEEFVKSTIFKKSECLNNEDLLKSVANGKINKWVKQENGGFKKECIGEHKKSVVALQVLLDGNIVSGGFDNYIFRWIKQENEIFKKELVGENESCVNTLQVLPNEEIVSGDDDGKIYRWFKQNNGIYQRELIGKCKTKINTLQVLSNGNILSGDDDGKIKIWR